MPKRFLAVTQAGALVVGATATGGIERVILGAGRAGGPAATDGRRVYYTRGMRDDCYEVWTVPHRGGTPRKLAIGDSPAVSPGRTRLAYVDSGYCGGKEQRVVVRSISSGRERVWSFGNEDEVDGGIGPVTWTADGRRVLVDSCGVDACMTFELDPAKAGGEPQGRWFGQDVEDVMGTPSSPVVRGRLGTVLMHLHEQDQHLGMIEYDPKRGTARTFPDLDVVDADASGRFLLYFDRTGDLMAWYDGKSIRIGPGYGSASW